MKIEQVMTDNGAAYRSRRFAKLLRRLGIGHIRTRPYTPRTNGKAERFIQTLLREWAYAYIYPSSDHRARELQPWMYHYNFHRPHSATSHRPPITRLGFDGYNVLRNYSYGAAALSLGNKDATWTSASGLRALGSMSFCSPGQRRLELLRGATPSNPTRAKAWSNQA